MTIKYTLQDGCWNILKQCSKLRSKREQELRWVSHNTHQKTEDWYLKKRYYCTFTFLPESYFLTKYNQLLNYSYLYMYMYMYSYSTFTFSIIHQLISCWFHVHVSRLRPDSKSRTYYILRKNANTFKLFLHIQNILNIQLLCHCGHYTQPVIFFVNVRVIFVFACFSCSTICAWRWEAELLKQSRSTASLQVAYNLPHLYFSGAFFWNFIEFLHIFRSNE